MRRDSRLTTIREALTTGPDGNRRACQRIWGRAYGAPMDTGASGNVWVSDPQELALRVFTRLYGRPDTTIADGPLAQADKLRHQGDIEGEICTLMSAGVELGAAPWYPARPGDLVHIAFEQAGDFPAYGETYIVAAAGGPNEQLLSMKLLTHTCPLMDDQVEESVGFFAVDAHEDPLYEPWFEAGPHRLTIVRDGRPVHVGGAR